MQLNRKEGALFLWMALCWMTDTLRMSESEPDKWKELVWGMRRPWHLIPADAHGAQSGNHFLLSALVTWGHHISHMGFQRKNGGLSTCQSALSPEIDLASNKPGVGGTPGRGWSMGTGGPGEPRAWGWGLPRRGVGNGLEGSFGQRLEQYSSFS